jgi:hypothetical protein
MKTLAEKIDKVMDTILYCDLRTDVGVDKAINSIRTAIKEQDRDTRHACAEAIAGCESVESENRIRKDEAMGACMNVKAV